MRMGRVLHELEELDRRLQAAPPDALLGTASLHASLIDGGREMSSYPDRCTLKLERRTVTGESTEQATAEIEAIVARLREADAEFHATVTPWWHVRPTGSRRSTRCRRRVRQARAATGGDDGQRGFRGNDVLDGRGGIGGRRHPRLYSSDPVGPGYTAARSTSRSRTCCAAGTRWQRWHAPGSDRSYAVLRRTRRCGSQHVTARIAFEALPRAAAADFPAGAVVSAGSAAHHHALALEVQDRVVPAQAAQHTARNARSRASITLAVACASMPVVVAVSRWG